MFSPEHALAIIEAIPHLTPVLSKKGARKGQHIKYAYRFAGGGASPRHISVSRHAANHGITVYVNKNSASGVPYPANLPGIEILQFYPKGSVGETGDKGLSSAAGGMATLLPENNDVYRLAIGGGAALKALLEWYYDTNKSAAFERQADPLSHQNAVANNVGVATEKRIQPHATLDLNVLVNDFIGAFTGTREGRLAQGGIGIRTGRHWFASIYIERLAPDNLIEVVVKPNALSELLNGCPVDMIERWIAFHQQTTGNEARGHRPAEPWPCIGFASIAGFNLMLADWRDLKVSWISRKPHAAFAAFLAGRHHNDAVLLNEAQSGVLKDEAGQIGGQSPATPGGLPGTGPDRGDAASMAEAIVDDVTLRAIKTRRGQSSFRSNLLSAYRSECAFTGCPVETVLEAAHIKSHSEGGDYATNNGLLLRADIHTLFDLYLLGVDQENKIRVSNRLKNSEYFQLRGKPISLPTNLADYPCQAGLASHLAKLKAVEEME